MSCLELEPIPAQSGLRGRVHLDGSPVRHNTDTYSIDKQPFTFRHMDNSVTKAARLWTVETHNRHEEHMQKTCKTFALIVRNRNNPCKARACKEKGGTLFPDHEFKRLCEKTTLLCYVMYKLYLDIVWKYYILV